MGYQVYKVGNRWGGYGVPTICEHPDCNEEIDRGISYACGGEPFSEHGCDRYFCEKHLDYSWFKSNGARCTHKNDCGCVMVELCERCRNKKESFDYKPETKEWLEHILTDGSWESWRKDNSIEIEAIEKQLLELKSE